MCATLRKALLRASEVLLTDYADHTCGLTFFHTLNANNMYVYIYIHICYRPTKPSASIKGFKYELLPWTINDPKDLLILMPSLSSRVQEEALHGLAPLEGLSSCVTQTHADLGTRTP